MSNPASSSADRCSVGCSAADFLFGGDFSGHFTNVSVQLSDVCCSAGCAGDVVTLDELEISSKFQHRGRRVAVAVLELVGMHNKRL